MKDLYKEKYAAADKQTKRVEKLEAKTKYPKSWDKYIASRQAQVAKQSNGHSKT